MYFGKGISSVQGRELTSTSTRLAGRSLELSKGLASPLGFVGSKHFTWQWIGSRLIDIKLIHKGYFMNKSKGWFLN